MAVTVYKEFCLNMETNNTLDLTFSPSRTSNNAFAFINGIEIVSMPTNLYYSAAKSPGVKDVGKKVTYHIKNNSALEMVYRINIGGSTLLPVRDTGMYRIWDGKDDLYMDVLSRRLSVIQSNTSTQPKFVKIPRYTAPDEIYQTGRSTGTNETIHMSYNLTWAFPVDPKFSYLVRLHFCEFDPDITLLRDRVFQIYIANQTAEEGADIIEWSGGNGIPIYRDYVVFMSDPGGQEKVLFVSLQANAKYGQTSTYGILNGSKSSKYLTLRILKFPKFQTSPLL
ncbi:hypothetical protein M0R45_016265 [Rubus argutus]|uniref:Malectin-like domain-containing protein n=1 Tax=Rubus argutus TaxID=59490 RepID=A0AAW1XSV6_RUBAR